MKGKNTFTKQEIESLNVLIRERKKVQHYKQKTIRAKMRKIELYGRYNFGLNDLQLEDFENLINTGIIKIDGQKVIPTKTTKKVPQAKFVEKENSNASKGEFILFDPLIDDSIKLPDEPGNYIVCLRAVSKLPTTKFSYVSQLHNDKEVIYVGIAGKSLRKRDFRQHFNGNAESSTFRKSIASLFSFKKIPSSKNKDNGKAKFSKVDEAKLSQWMKKNFLLYFIENNQPEFVNIIHP